MKLRVKVLEFFAGRPVAILNVHTADKINVHVDERVKISKKKNSIISVVDTATRLIKPNEIVVSNEILEELKLKKGSCVEVSLAQEPESTEFIKKKLNCQALKKDEMQKIVQDIVRNALTETEIAYFVSAVYKCGMSSKEVEYLVKAMVGVGRKLSFKGKVVDKHSISGVAGNRTTPLVVSICAAAGLVIPKTSSRAITSAAGTADVIESIAEVEFTEKQIKKIVKKTGGCLVWGGSLGLSPADDKIIQVERILHLDPEPQLLASILSKKISVGSDYIIIDIPYGKSAKVDKKRALSLKKRFESLAKKFNIKLKAVLTDGSQPIGNGIGPLLEIKDLLDILERKEKRPLDLEKKSVFLAAQIFELCGKSKQGQGQKLAQDILDSGKAFEKFKQIIKAQNGAIPKHIGFAKFKQTICAARDGKIKEVDNKKIKMMGVLAGSPMEDTTGLYLYHHVGDKIKKGDPLISIYTESKIRMKDVRKFYKKSEPIVY